MSILWRVALRRNRRWFDAAMPSLRTCCHLYFVLIVEHDKSGAAMTSNRDWALPRGFLNAAPVVLDLSGCELLHDWIRTKLDKLANLANCNIKIRG